MKRIFTDENIRLFYGVLAVIEVIVIYYTVCLSENRMISEGHFWFCVIIQFCALIWFLHKAGAFIWQHKPEDEEK